MSNRTATSIVTPTNRLASCVDTEGGWTFDELVSSADERVATMNDALITYVYAQTDEILLAIEQPEQAVFADRHTIARLALGLAEVAGYVGLESVGDVAKGLVLLIEGLDEQKSWNLDAVRVHATTLALSCRTPSGSGLKHVVCELASLRAAIGIASS